MIGFMVVAMPTQLSRRIDGAFWCRTCRRRRILRPKPKAKLEPAVFLAARDVQPSARSALGGSEDP